MSDDLVSKDGAPDGAMDVAIVTVPATGNLVVRFLGPVIGIWTHWHRNRSVACTGEESCPAPTHRDKTIWKGYAAVEYLKVGAIRLWVPGVLEVTEALQEYLGPENRRGEVWSLQRGRVTATRAECRGRRVRCDDPRPLRTDVEVEKAVRRLYRNLWVQFGMPPPFGSRQVLAPSPVEADQVEAPAGEAVEQEDSRHAQAMLRRHMAEMRHGGPKPPPNGQTGS